MIAMDVKVTGLKEMQSMLKQFPADAPQVFGDAVQKAGARLRDEVKGLSNIPVKTGRMRQSINSRRIALLASGVFVGTDYGVYVHEGTSKMPPRPFFQWALQGGAMKAINDIFASAMKLLPK